jgi:mannose-1-phosphate guanylyltransferase
MTLHAVIMAGGSGTRFWPASRQARPKQVLPLAGGKPLIAAAIERVAGLCEPERTWVVTNQKQRKAIGKLLLDFPFDQIVIEPEPRDTGPCIALAMATIAQRDPDATIVVLPADHVIEPIAEFERMVRRGVELARDDETIVTFGVRPTFPATGYGYIECGEPIDSNAPAARRAKRFREKPDLATAKVFLASEHFLWNSGIFVWRLAAMRRAMAKSCPELAAAEQAMAQAIAGGKRAALTRAFQQAKRISIDYAVMEHADKVAVVDCTARWDDVGSFPALAGVLPADADGNHVLAHDGASAVALASKGNIVYVEGKRTVALFGVEDLVVAAVGDAVLVCPRERAADLKALVEQLRASGRTDLL